MDLDTEKAFRAILENERNKKMTLEDAKDVLWDLFQQGALGSTTLDSTQPPNEGVQNHINTLLEKLNQQLASHGNYQQKVSLQSIPPEIRRRIFHYLLTNPELGEASSIAQRQKYGADVQYGLSPAVLLVCKKFHEEASEVLYGSNTFIIECLPEIIQKSLDERAPLTACSPITRFKNNVGNVITIIHASNKSLLDEVPAIKYVKKWRVVLSAKDQVHLQHTEPRSRLELITFCRLLCEYQTQRMGLRDLEIVIIPKGVEDDSWMGLDPDYLIDIREMRKKLLLPFELLRNISKIMIRTAEIAEIPDFACSDTWIKTPLVTQALLPPNTSIQRLVKLLQGNEEVEKSTKMFEALLRYVKTFERDPEFKEQMGMSSFDFVHLSPNEIAKLKENPFWTATFHPRGLVHTVEHRVSRARHLAEIQYLDTTDNQKFKEDRHTILQYLERQFYRIKFASRVLFEFVKIQNKDGLFSPFIGYHKFSLHRHTEALVLLEDYAESFNRELDPSTKRAIRVRGGLFTTRYESMPREVSLKLCGIAYQMRDVVAFNEHFRNAVDDMNCQYREMLEARAQLYEWDLRDTISEIDIQLPSPKDWEIKWDTPEQNEIAQSVFDEDEASFEGHTQTSELQLDLDLELAPNPPQDFEEAGDLDTTGWDSLPFHDDDDFYLLTYQPNNDTSQSNSSHTAEFGADSNSEYNFYEEIFMDHPDDESLYSHSEDDNDLGSGQQYLITITSILEAPSLMFFLGLGIPRILHHTWSQCS